jgi:hypothetical protein
MSRTLSTLTPEASKCAGYDEEDGSQGPPCEPNLDERKRNHKRERSVSWSADVGEGDAALEESMSPSKKKLEPRRLFYSDADVTGGSNEGMDTGSAAKEDEEEQPRTQPYHPDSPEQENEGSPEHEEEEEGECSEPSELKIAG